MGKCQRVRQVGNFPSAYSRDVAEHEGKTEFVHLSAFAMSFSDARSVLHQTNWNRMRNNEGETKETKDVISVSYIRFRMSFFWVLGGSLPLLKCIKGARIDDDTSPPPLVSIRLQ